MDNVIMKLCKTNDQVANIFTEVLRKEQLNTNSGLAEGTKIAQCD